MDKNHLIPTPHKLLSEYIQYHHDTMDALHQYRFGKINAEEAMEQMAAADAAHRERYDALWNAFNDSLKGEM